MGADVSATMVSMDGQKVYAINIVFKIVVEEGVLKLRPIHLHVRCWRLPILSCLALFLLCACKGGNASGNEIKSISIMACGGLAPGTEDCHIRLMWNSAECYPGKPCERLVVYWAGGNQTCEDVDSNNVGAFDPLLGHYVDRGFVAACAQPFTTEQEGGRHPYQELDPAGWTATGRR